MSSSTSITNQQLKKLELGLLLLRWGVGIVFLMWTFDKLINPGHAAAVFKHFYNIDGLGITAAYALGFLQLILVISFMAGAFKKYSYGIILILHTISTAVAYSKYLDPWGPSNLLFFAAFPLLAACWLLWSVRDLDKKLSFDHR